ncbi:MarR family winged helix-turn-helix transcriptional regulator [Paenibacillus puldeungensis]|uniref:MarR family winged helix-turn-helix transcriptional regulator n=1 Tax=Paenibacillus puldeungensis TaxID=696536 RepID=A0ABW3S027_9BACL
MIEHNAASMISKIRDAVNKMIVTELEKNGVADIAPSHGDILSLLYHSYGMPISVLAEKINRSQPTVTVLVNKLVRLGYVERKKDDKDKRVTLIRLTEKGESIGPLFHQVSNRLNEIIYEGLDLEEQEKLENMLKRILQRF